MNTLYPLKFTPIFKQTIWGGNRLKETLMKENAPENCGESWEISSVEDNVSVVCNGFLKGNSLEELIEVYMGDLVGEKVYQQFGLEFPLLIKFIDANDNLSIQVHPDDKLAKERHNSFGKTEMWYVLDSKADTLLINGFKHKISKEEYLEALKNKKILDLMNSIKTSKGDAYFIPAGRVHAIGSGNLIAEIQQTSNITYRIYDYERKDKNGNQRELHTDLAVDAIDYNFYDNYKSNYSPKANQSVNIVDCNYFTTNKLDITQDIQKDYPEIDSFVIYMCVEGSMQIIFDESQDSVEIKKGETVLIPAMIKNNLILKPNGKCEIVESYIK